MAGFTWAVVPISSTYLHTQPFIIADFHSQWLKTAPNLLRIPQLPARNLPRPIAATWV
jgi:hypothetical protein